jgi:C-terminal processing protease CtpA/Prc
VLHTLGIVTDLDHTAFTFETDEGKQLTLDVVPVPVDASFISTTIGAAKAEPLNRMYPAEPFRFTYLPESQAIYLNFRTYVSLEDNVKKLFQMVDANPVKKLDIDVRQNSGGDFTKARRSLIPEIKRRPAINQKGSLFVIIGRRTFSAAMVNSLDLRKDTNAYLVGEPIGELPNSYSENDEMTLPNSKIVVSYSTRYYKFVDGENVVMPDKRIDPTWADYKSGRDVVLDWILSGDKKIP